MTVPRVRIRFRKAGDLRLIGHRDLVRTLERLFRRAGLALVMSEGYHPRARMSFPSALAVGIEGTEEIIEIALAEEFAPDALRQRLNHLAPPGLVIADVRLLGPGEAKARIAAATYEIPVPLARRETLRSSIDDLLRQTSCTVERQQHKAPVDVRPGLQELVLQDGILRMTLQVAPTGSVRPREILEVLGLGDLESQGFWLTRTFVEMAT